MYDPRNLADTKRQECLCRMFLAANQSLVFRAPRWIWNNSEKLN